MDLENLTLKSSQFDKLKLPLNLLYGKIGKLSAHFSLTGLMSEPIRVTLERVNIVFTPKDKADWNVMQETVHNEFAMKELLLDQVATQIYHNLIEIKDEKQNEKTWREMIIDNLQVEILNLHVRFESNN